MLVDNKFIYLSLPRCASTSFHYSCLLNDIDVKTYNGEWELINANVDFKSVDKQNLMDYIYHGHESIINLQLKFGTQYPTIAVKRNRHERFYSLYKHVLFEFQRFERLEFYNIFSKFTLDELFFFTKNDLISKKTRWDKICQFLIDLKLINEKPFERDKNSLDESKRMDAYMVNIIDILITPVSFWTNNDKNIIWFDFDKLNELEEWASNILDKPFTLHSVNSSKHIVGDLILNDEFIKKYNDIYDYYDIPKLANTLI